MGSDLCSGRLRGPGSDLLPWVALSSKPRESAVYTGPGDLRFHPVCPWEPPGARNGLERLCARVHEGPNPGPEPVDPEYQSLQVLELVPQLEELCGGEQDGVEGVDHG